MATSPHSALVLSLFPQGDGAELTGTDREDDAVLLERVCESDHDAFATLVRRHSIRYYRVAYRFVRARVDAEDIVQDAFIKLWERPDSWQKSKNTAFTTWFYRVVINQCLDHAKKKRPGELKDEANIADERDTHEESMLKREKQRLLETQIALLPERQRTALNLCFYEELSNQEAADIMGVKLKALQSLLIRAKTVLKEQLKFMLEV